jgi:hypothetical protein
MEDEHVHVTTVFFFRETILIAQRLTLTREGPPAHQGEKTTTTTPGYDILFRRVYHFFGKIM